LNAITVAISTDVTISGQVQSNLIIGSSYSVGIGSTNPARKLDVVDSGASGSVIRSKVTTNNGGYLAYEALNSSGTSVFSVNHNGGVTLAGDVIFASGQGLDFSADGNAAGMTSELLDDYEEGTWTPTDGSGASLSFTAVSGVYTRIGRIITCQTEFSYPSTASVANAKVGGLPFTAINKGGGFSMYTTAAAGSIAIRNESNTTDMLLTSGTDQDTALTNVGLSGAVIQITFIYQIF
jgi:hypothetical protein